MTIAAPSGVALDSNIMRKKPDFSHGAGELVDANFITDDVRTELMLHLNRSQLTDQQKAALLSFANNIGQEVIDREVESGKNQRVQIEAIEANAKRLLASLSVLSRPAIDALHAHTDYLAYGTAPSIEINEEIKNIIKRPGESILSSTWDWVEALENAAQYAASKYHVDKQSKPEQMRARDYVSMLAERVRELTGRPPPKDRSTWFAGFSTCLGEHFGLPIGPRVIASGIDSIAR